MDNNKRILVCPLNWGLGHASRMVPVISQLINHGFTVVIGADEAPLRFLRNEFPSLDWVEFSSYKIKYSKHNTLVFKMLWSLPKVIQGIYKEHRQVREIIKQKQIDIVISDNRFGLWNKEVRTIFVTHQISIKTPAWLRFLEYPLYKINIYFIAKYNKCWIPDFENEPNLSGDLSHKRKIPKHASFIGALSRFQGEELLSSKQNNKILVILSGPEPQRTIFEKIIVSQLQNEDYDVTIVRGMVDDAHEYALGKNMQFISHLNSTQMRKEILSSDIVICRAGYSSIMDLVALNKTAILVPTPGQTEQGYLAKLHMKQKRFLCVKQSALNLQLDIDGFLKFKKELEFDEGMQRGNENLIKEIKCL